MRGSHVSVPKSAALSDASPDPGSLDAMGLGVSGLLLLGPAYSLEAGGGRRVVVCDNNLQYGWSQDREIDGNTGDARIFRGFQASWRIIALHPVFLYCSWQLVLSFLVPLWGASTPPFIFKGGKITKKITE
jgi:hypothetical protein